jgi:hypothetical protein
MAKSSKSQNPEFLEKRRRAIVELAKRRGQGRRLVSSAAAPLGTAAKETHAGKPLGPVAYTPRPQVPN